ncbi:hypothetical protein D3C83_195400 [compost metagenome]
MAWLTVLFSAAFRSPLTRKPPSRISHLLAVGSLMVAESAAEAESAWPIAATGRAPTSSMPMSVFFIAPPA